MDITEINVMTELRGKNPRALEYIMEAYGKPMYALVKRILNNTGSEEDIEECVSDAFVQAWERSSTYDESKGSLRTWLLILAKYRALDCRRKLCREEPMSEYSDETAGSSGESAENKVIAKEKFNEVVDIIKEFGEPDRSILIRRYFLYESVESIAGYFGLTLGAVYKRLWRGRKLLKERLGNAMAEEGLYE